MATVTATKFVYDFSEGSREMRELLGGKGANVAEMVRLLGPGAVPQGFTITTEACVSYMQSGGVQPEGLDDQVGAALGRLQQQTGKTVGDGGDPLLVSVRSGARDSMPGMMDTVLNLGLNDETVKGLAARTGNERFAWDCYRRLVQMFANVVRSIDGDLFEQVIKEAKVSKGVETDSDLGTDDLRELTGRFFEIYRSETGERFPQGPEEQLDQAIRAVFDSWNGDRAVEYRRINHIPDDWGTAVNVQQMVFGNMGESSGSGVAFSRDERTGAPHPSGDFLINAQGEDVVSGVRTPRDLEELKELMPEAYGKLIEILATLEHHYKDMQDVEFTIEEGKLYMLQTRGAKRPAQAAVRVAVDMAEEGLLRQDEALLSLDAGQLDALLHPTIDPEYDYNVLARGVNASPGAAKGGIVFTAAEAVEKSSNGEDVVLVRPFTEADDVAGFHAARGILTSEGGKASHAALVARGMGRPCVAGAGDLKIDVERGIAEVGGKFLHEGDLIVIDGTTGNITTDNVPLVDPEPDPYFQKVLEWADGRRLIAVRANADNPDDAGKARRFGAQGIGLCRTEHMFMEADRQPKMKRMILAATEEERRKALDKLMPLQQRDFEGIFEAMSGLPVTIRLLDPPLHEFLPGRVELELEIANLRSEGANGERIDELEQELVRVRQLEETNPMLGTRGCRLAFLYPEIYEMQAEAIFRAARSVKQRLGQPPSLEIMIPLVDYPQELKLMRELVDRVALTVAGGKVDYQVGTMIELPNACLLAYEIAQYADFFSFGTNDLTQTVLGFSRDDAEASFLTHYLDSKVISRSPFETLDVEGVGKMVQMAIERARSAKPEIKLGICGEHGGDPDSVIFFDHAGLDYVSCSPYRVPLARIAAAQAAIGRR